MQLGVPFATPTGGFRHERDHLAGGFRREIAADALGFGMGRWSTAYRAGRARISLPSKPLTVNRSLDYPGHRGMSGQFSNARDILPYHDAGVREHLIDKKAEGGISCVGTTC
jgi:hypothetical protein